jgi:hypothetical protein
LERGHDLKVGFVSGDDLMPILGKDLAALKDTLPPHPDSDNPDVKLPWNTLDPSKSKSIPLVSANAYLGARAIVQGLRLGADIIICGRVADASPVIGAAWYWHSWSDTDYDRLAGALIAGHLIECSAYVSGGNFAGFTEHDQEIFMEPGFPIAEIEADGTCVITKHEGTGGMIDEDTVRCQFLYELQGSIYLNSDVKAYLNDVRVKTVGKDRYVDEIRFSSICCSADEDAQGPCLGNKRSPTPTNHKSHNLLSWRFPITNPCERSRIWDISEMGTYGSSDSKEAPEIRSRQGALDSRVPEVCHIYSLS